MKESRELVRRFRHSARPNWGVGRMLWERGTKRCLLFDDGTERVFKRPYFDMLEEQEPRMELLPAAPEKGKKAKPGARMSMDAQIELFLEDFPGGFQDPGWIAEHRDPGGSGRVCKRHREAQITEAQRCFDRERLDKMLADGEFQTIQDDLVRILAGTDLVTRARVRALEKVEAGEGLIRQLRFHLHGDGPDDVLFDAWCRGLAVVGVDLDWRLVTAVGALYRPDREVCVHPSVMRAQARSMGLAPPKGHPTFRSYRPWRDLTRRVAEELEHAGHEPRDMLDVHDFVWETLRPSARKRIKARQARTSEAAAQPMSPGAGADEATAAL